MNAQCKDFKVVDLRKLAQAKNIPGRSSMNKEELCNALGYTKKSVAQLKICKEMKVPELRKLAKENDIRGRTKMTKKELCKELGYSTKKRVVTGTGSRKIKDTTKRPKSPVKSLVKKSPAKSKLLSGLPDVDTIILSKLPDKKLAAMCQVDKYVSSLCNDETLWNLKFNLLFPGIPNFKNAKKNYESYAEWANYPHATTKIENLLSWSIRYDHLNIFKWIVLVQKITPSIYTTIRYTSDHVNALKWLLKYYKDNNMEIHIDLAATVTLAGYGHLDALKTISKYFSSQKLFNKFAAVMHKIVENEEYGWYAEMVDKKSKNNKKAFAIWARSLKYE